MSNPVNTVAKLRFFASEHEIASRSLRAAMETDMKLAPSDAAPGAFLRLREIEAQFQAIPEIRAIRNAMETGPFGVPLLASLDRAIVAVARNREASPEAVGRMSLPDFTGAIGPRTP